MSSNTINAVEVMGVVLRAASDVGRQQVTYEDIARGFPWNKPSGGLMSAQDFYGMTEAEGSSAAVKIDRQGHVRFLDSHEAGYTDEKGRCLVTGFPIMGDPDEPNPELVEFRDRILELQRRHGMRERATFPTHRQALVPLVDHMTDLHYAVLAVVRAFHQAGISLDEARTSNGVMVFVSTTGRTNLGGLIGAAMNILGLSRSRWIVRHMNFGCAGLGAAINEMATFMKAHEGLQLGVVVGTNSTSGSAMHPDITRTANEHPHPWAAATPWFFADGGSALIFERCGQGRLTSCESSLPIELVDFMAGGSDFPLYAGNWQDARYTMNAGVVAEVFFRAMMDNAEMLTRMWGVESITEFMLIAIHQANFKLVRELADMLDMLDRTLRTPDIGNTVCPSTGIVISRAIEMRLVQPGDLIGQLVIGAGYGAQLANSGMIYLPRDA